MRKSERLPGVDTVWIWRSGIERADATWTGMTSFDGVVKLDNAIPERTALCSSLGHPHSHLPRSQQLLVVAVYSAPTLTCPFHRICLVTSWRTSWRIAMQETILSISADHLDLLAYGLLIHGMRWTAGVGRCLHITISYDRVTLATLGLVHVCYPSGRLSVDYSGDVMHVDDPKTPVR